MGRTIRGGAINKGSRVVGLATRGDDYMHGEHLPPLKGRAAPGALTPLEHHSSNHLKLCHSTRAPARAGPGIRGQRRHSSHVTAAGNCEALQAHGTRGDDYIFLASTARRWDEGRRQSASDPPWSSQLTYRKLPSRSRTLSLQDAENAAARLQDKKTKT